MKKVLLCAWLLLLVGEAMAQVAQQIPTGRKQAAGRNIEAKKGTKKKQQSRKDTTQNSGVYTMTSISNNKAFSNASPFNRFTITDPTILSLNAKAGGANIKFNGSSMIGVPKGTYGFADGRLTFYATGSTSSGTITGTGSVGTGTSPGAVGTFGPGMGVNGKSPFAGPGAYGTRIPVLTRPPDSSAGFGIRRRF